MMQSEFTQRAARISSHGLGLSVDVYQPDLMHLVQTLRDGGLRPGYLEIFKATTTSKPDPAALRLPLAHRVPRRHIPV